jgi:hypothetical protein
MTAPTLELTGPDTLTNGHRTTLAGAAARLSDAHLEAAHAAAGLDFDQASVWARAHAAISDVAAEAYQVTALITARRTPNVAARLRPVARLRELAVAQAGLMRVLDGLVQFHQPAAMVAAEAVLSAQRVHLLALQLGRIPGAPAEAATESDLKHDPGLHNSTNAE